LIDIKTISLTRSEDAEMNFSVTVYPTAGQFEASLVGSPNVSATAPTRAQALAALEIAIEKRVAQGELLTLEIGRKGLAGLFGKYRDDPTIQDICDEAYKERDADVRE
jgi:hypothetical protein